LQVRADPATAGIPFIFLTAMSDRRSMRKGMELGADDYLTKPFLPPELLAAVVSRLRRHATIGQEYEQHLEQARRVLVRMVTHELRTPLIAVSTATEIISRQIGQLSMSQVEELLTDLSTGSRRLNRIVEQMVLLTQLEAGSLRQDALMERGLQSQMWELLTVAIDLARRFAYRHPDVNIRLAERDTEVQVLCDRNALKHAFAEVITNAVNFSPQGVDVVVSQWVADEQVWVTVVDTGPGIPEAQQQRIFEDFYQFEREAQDQQGLGLGLPLARRIVEAHGGTLKLNSVVGKGTQVVIGLPRWTEEDPAIMSAGM
jgi:two-component system sensor histidine kinase/response regulator